MHVTWYTLLDSKVHMHNETSCLSHNTLASAKNDLSRAHTPSDVTCRKNHKAEISAGGIEASSKICVSVFGTGLLCCLMELIYTLHLESTMSRINSNPHVFYLAMHPFYVACETGYVASLCASPRVFRRSRHAELIILCQRQLWHLLVHSSAG
jgi:hypothetical protein